MYLYMKSTHFLIICLVLSIFGQSLCTHSTALVESGNHWWEPAVDDAARAALRQLSKDKNVRSGLRLNKIGIEDTKMTEGIMYSLGIEMDVGSMRGAQYELSFLEPLSEWRPLWFNGFAGALPSGNTAQPTALSTGFNLPPLPITPDLSLTLRGPVEIHFPETTTEIHIRTPREVDVGLVEKVYLAEGVNMTLSGMAELRLRESVPVDIILQPEEQKILVDMKQTPKINVFGTRVDITNLNTEERLKVRKSGVSGLEIVSAAEQPVKKAVTTRMPFEIPLNDSRVQHLQLALAQLSAAHQLTQPPRIRRLLSTKLEAVTSFLIPLEVMEDGGNISNWEVVVVQGVNNKQNRVVSLNEKKMVPNEVTFAWSLMANGTLPSAYEAFNSFLNSRSQP